MLVVRARASYGMGMRMCSGGAAPALCIWRCVDVAGQRGMLPPV